ncbi:MAG: kinesin motor protein cin8 [Bogoriella megaspora]|nr:MAG: kinesin motor protein cin8 [Bogoriella megaspora]
MAVPQRAVANKMRPPMARPPPSRARSATPAFSGRASPADSLILANGNALRGTKSPQNSVIGGTKRKERDFENDGGEETNINVVVRCRGRSEREVRENSGVVVTTDGVKGKSVELSMGPSALSNKTYHFDKVFSPAADQNMIFEEVVMPILDEMLGGFNCTIFAYGQTGTGKTYTMTGDITDIQPSPVEAGIIPRVLDSLFTKLENEAAESYVKCSFIELYNEELRDLLSTDDNVKLKIFDEANKKGGSSTMVQGMEESHITNASRGIHLLREGSHKRQVAATKCNDLSSRSHTVFTITVGMKRTSDTGEEFMSTGKLNLVDLAGSENIQRSGAENKRAAEAGLINKSLLTLGRVINALVDKSSHIPYRESKLTRLLQDSLGGRTKTCIIATLSPAKSNLEETISTLDYAFRAKNIRNKPQVNSMISKKTLLKEFTAEIEKLKSELIATRQRNGVYLTTENYEQIVTESDSRRILSEEQKDKIETMETNLRNKVQELFSLTTNFNHLKKENEATKNTLHGTEDILKKTESVLALTRQSLNEETAFRKAHQATEEHLSNLGKDMISTLGRTTSDINGLRSKIRRKSDLQSVNRDNWVSSRVQVCGVASSVDDHIGELQSKQQDLIAGLSSRMQNFVQDELRKLSASQTFLKDKMEAFEASKDEVNAQTSKARDDMNEVLEEIKTLREDVKQKVGTGLNDLSAAAQRISAGIVTELEAFHGQLHASYSSLGKDFKNTFDDLARRLNDQQTEADTLRAKIAAADEALIASNQATQEKLTSTLEKEKQKAASERAQLLEQMTNIVNSTALASEARVEETISSIVQSIGSSTTTHSQHQTDYRSQYDSWSRTSRSIVDSVVASRETVKSKIKQDWTAANEHTNSIKGTTTAVHDETVRIVSNQMAHMETQLSSLDEVVSRLRAQNESHHAAHTSSLAGLSGSVQESYDSIGGHLNTSYNRVKELNTDVGSRTSDLDGTIASMDEDATIRAALRELRNEIGKRELLEYEITGETPQKTEYTYPTSLPHTETQDRFLAKLRGLDTTPPPRPRSKIATPSGRSKSRSPRKQPPASPLKPLRSSPTKTLVFNDTLSAPSEPSDPIPLNPLPLSTSLLSEGGSRPPTATSSSSSTSRPPTSGPGLGLRELDRNTLNNMPLTHTTTHPQSRSDPLPTTGLGMGMGMGMGIKGDTEEGKQPPLKKQNVMATEKESKLPMKRSARMTVAGVENAQPGAGGGNLGASIGPGGVGGGRVLRRRGGGGSD